MLHWLAHHSIIIQRCLVRGVMLASWLLCQAATGSEPTSPTAALFKQYAQLNEKYCADCHRGAEAEAQLDLAAWCTEPGTTSLSAHFSDWRRVSRALTDRSMPPKDSAPLPEIDRQQMLDILAAAMRATLAQHATDPGPTIVRRLTSAEYDYCLEDLTGLKLQLGEQFVSDSVGGSGFTNSAAAQFMQDATLERYLEAARRVAEHAMIGTGSIYFYHSPGETGLELSAAERIQQIYRRHGFRSAAGEGAEPYGLERFATAFQVAWQYRYRAELGQPDISLVELAGRAKLETKFATHIWEVLQRREVSFPLSDIIERWQHLPSPQQLARSLPPSINQESNHNQERNEQKATQHVEQSIARLTQDLYAKVQSWQARLAGSASAEEEAAVLADGHVSIPAQVSFVARALRKRKVSSHEFTPDLNNAKLYSDDGRVRFKLTIEAASARQEALPVVIFSKSKFRFRVVDLVQPDPLPLSSVLDADAVQRLGFGQNLPGGEPLQADEFALSVGQSITLEFKLPDDCRLGELLLEARMDRQLGRNSIVRCIIDDVTDGQGRSFSSLLRDANSPSMDEWEAGLADFARCLPQISHREPVPSDRDPIPAPYDNTYNVPERNLFHASVKYHRDDRFLREHLLPPETAGELDLAWNDLLTSFDYHDVNVRFVGNKFGIQLDSDRPLVADAPWLQAIDELPRQHIERFLSEKAAMQAARAHAELEHQQNVLDFATRAWRRSLTTDDADALRAFYFIQREQHGLGHAAAIRACLVRILVSPDFLFRVEQPAEQNQSSQHAHDLTAHELANRLSFSLWSSIPDDELRDLADRGLLNDDRVLEQQVQRMLQSAKSRRLSTEFFGQWLGFYQFDRFRGVDTQRFPEFDEALQRALYEEAISFCSHIIQADLPYRKLLTADTTFVDKRVAEHYAIPWDENWTSPRKISQINQFHRGGVFGLGAVLTSTSAPLRTSPVKRGDWILRRILGTPVPPPPADAGSIPAEEVLADGQTVRQRLEAHRNHEACMNCHVRIDPLGFTLEHFDSLGRWRDKYADGRAIDASGQLADGHSISGLNGLQGHLAASDELFRRTFASKLVAYFLGRTETVADAALVEQIMQQWQDDPRFSTAIITIVKSPQFRKIRSKA